MPIFRHALFRFLTWVSLSGALFGHAALARQTDATHHRPTVRHDTQHASSISPHRGSSGRHGHVTQPARTHAVASQPHRHRQVAPSRPLIIIDPGHGGQDSGAVGLAGTLKKNVDLATALELKRLLEATGRYRVVMTRTSDVAVSLASRRAFARTNHGALFISIHENASKDRHAHGACVYVRRHGSDGESASRLGSTESMTDVLTGQQPHPRPGSAWLQSVMIDNLDDDIHMASGPARDAHFYVLGVHSVPSVLLEMGFLSNRHDEVLLNRAKYRSTIARAIRDAVDDYFTALRHPDALRT